MMDSREPVSVVFIGHVDAGKSTLGGQIMYQTGQVDERTLDKYKREAGEKGRGSWAMSWFMDENPEERDKGKTVETARAYFDTDKKRFTILDAPGHKGYITEMISGASQADIAVLVISARTKEFEAGFKRGGQTSEHALLVKTSGVKKIVCVINKMDDPSVNWSEKRYKEIVGEMKPFLNKKVGYNNEDIMFIPISGLSGANVKDEMKGADKIEWYNGPSFLNYMNELPSFKRGDPNLPLRIPVVYSFKDSGTFVIGKIEQGSIHNKDALVIMPGNIKTEVQQIFCNEIEKSCAGPGENVRLKLHIADSVQLKKGMVICRQNNLVCNTKVFDVKLQFVNYDSIITKGFKSIIHIHSAEKEVQFKKLIAKLDKNGNIEKKLPDFIRKKDICICQLETNEPICVETFKDCSQLGRFTLREKNETIAMGVILKLRV